MKKRLSAIFLIVVMLVSCFAGCGGSADQGTGSGTSTEQGSADTGSGEMKDSLVIGIPQDITGIVPFGDTWIANKDSIYAWQLYDSLLWRDSATGELSPCLAEEWSISDDGLTYTIKLREDVTFHNGTPLTTKDVQWSLDMCKENSVLNAVYYGSYDHTNIIDDYTCEIVLSEVFAPFETVLGGYGCLILSKDYYEEVGGTMAAYAEAPIGTGPYKFVSRSIGTDIKLEANENYWGEKPSIKNIEMKIISDTNTQTIALESGEIDVLYDASVSALTLLSAEGVQWDACESCLTCILYFASGEGKISMDENFRKAVMSTVDTVGICDAITEGYGGTGSCYAPSTFTATPKPGTYTEQYPYDLEAAKEYLAESSYVEGTEVNIGCIAGTKQETVAKIWQNELQQAGINAKLNATDSASFTAARETGQYDLWINTGMGATFDADYIYQCFIPGSSTTSDKFIESEELREMGAKARASTSLEERVEIYTDMMNTINEKALVGTMFYDANTLAWKSDLNCSGPLASLNYRINTWSWN